MLYPLIGTWSRIRLLLIRIWETIGDQSQRIERKRTRVKDHVTSRSPQSSSAGSSKPFESEYALKHKVIPETSTDKRKRLSQCTRCGSADHFWRKCPAPQPVVMSSKPGQKRKAEAAELKNTTIPKARCIEAAPAVKKVHTTEVRGFSPILEVDTDASD